MKWFRWYRDTVADVKLRTVALRANCHTTAAISFWAALLEDASRPEHRGICKMPIDMIAITLDLSVTHAEHMRDALVALGMAKVRGGDIHILKWNERQFESDADGTARERQRRKRLKENRSSHTSVTDAPKNVTRDSSPPEDRRQNTESESSKEEAREAARRMPSEQNGSEPKPKAPTPRAELLRTLDEQHADAVIEHRRKKYPLTAHAAKLLAGKFSKCSDPNAAADAMIANGWRGFEPEWLENRHARAGPVITPEKAAVLKRMEERVAREKAEDDAS